MATYYTTKDIKNEFEKDDVKVFCSTLNRAGKVRVTVARGGQDARTYKDCDEVVFQQEFAKWNSIPGSAFVKINSALSS